MVRFDGGCYIDIFAIRLGSQGEKQLPVVDPPSDESFELTPHCESALTKYMQKSSRDNCSTMSAVLRVVQTPNFSRYRLS